MKYRFNIPALFLALLMFTTTNGIAISEHICNTSQTHTFSLFSKAACDMEKQASSCCANKVVTNKKGCCEHRQYFSKLNIEGFTACQIHLTPYKIVTHYFYFNDFTCLTKYDLEHHFSGLPPPDNLYKIKALLQPSFSDLQIYLC